MHRLTVDLTDDEFVTVHQCAMDAHTTDVEALRRIIATQRYLDTEMLRGKKILVGTRDDGWHALARVFR